MVVDSELVVLERALNPMGHGRSNLCLHAKRTFEYDPSPATGALRALEREARIAHQVLRRGIRRTQREAKARREEHAILADREGFPEQRHDLFGEARELGGIVDL